MRTLIGLMVCLFSTSIFSNVLFLNHNPHGTGSLQFAVAPGSFKTPSIKTHHFKFISKQTLPMIKGYKYNIFIKNKSADLKWTTSSQRCPLVYNPKNVYVVAAHYYVKHTGKVALSCEVTFFQP